MIGTAKKKVLHWQINFEFGNGVDKRPHHLELSQQKRLPTRPSKNCAGHLSTCGAVNRYISGGD